MVTAKKKKMFGKKKNKIQIVDVSPEQCFWVNNGPVVKNLQELCDAVKYMDDAKFDHHTKEHGNDFAKWMWEALKMPDLSKKLLKAKTRKDAVAVLERALK